MIDVTDRYELHPGEAFMNVNGFFTIAPNSEPYRYIIVPRERGLVAEVTKPGVNNNFATGMICYTDENNKVYGTDAITPRGDDTTVVPAQYNRFELKFPEKATRVYVTSWVEMPPKIFKKVM